MELATPSLRITVSANVGSSMGAAVSTPDTTGTMVDSGNHIDGGGAARPAAQTDTETMHPTAVTPPRSLSHSSNRNPPIENSPTVGPVADNQTEMSDTLNNAEKALDTMKTWSTAVEKVKCVIDAVNPIAEVCFKKCYPVLS
jgi:hypothetical protein